MVYNPSMTQRLALLFAACLAALCASDRAGAKSPEDADRRLANLAEMNTLRQQMELVAIDTRFYTSIENLNDFIPQDRNQDDFDNINDDGGTLVIDRNTARWKPIRENLTDLPFCWQGPYVSYVPSRLIPLDNGYDRGTLIDFWGNPYLLFTPLGLARPDQQTITLEFYGDQFDRYAIVSFGPDMVMSGDDLIVEFGLPPTRLTVSSLVPDRASTGDEIEIRGYNFGEPASPSKGNLLSIDFPGVVLLNGEPIKTVKSWSNRSIVFTVPNGAESGTIQVRIGEDASAQVSQPRRLSILSAARSWKQYR